MADILIRGMEMPKYTMKAYFGIDADGNPLCMVYDKDGIEPDIYDVVSLPEDYGSLIDTDSLMQKREAVCWIRYKMFERNLENASTIVPAERGGKDGC